MSFQKFQNSLNEKGIDDLSVFDSFWKIKPGIETILSLKVSNDAIIFLEFAFTDYPRLPSWFKIYQI